jgi:hypothetical protein
MRKSKPLSQIIEAVENFLESLPKDLVRAVVENVGQSNASESYDAPESARNNARKVLDWKEKYGKECKGMTAVGWARARDLGNGSRLSADTVKRMASFNRHRSNYEKARIKPEAKTRPWTIPAIVCWLGWGGTTGIDWAIGVSKSIQKKSKGG